MTLLMIMAAAVVLLAILSIGTGGRRLTSTQEGIMAKRPTDKQYRETASRIYERDGEVEIDDNAPLSKAKGNPDKGCYVQAWVWVYDADAREA